MNALQEQRSVETITTEIIIIKRRRLPRSRVRPLRSENGFVRQRNVCRQATGLRI